jgi:polyferredoxin
VNRLGARKLVRARRIVQAVFLILFIVLVWWATFAKGPTDKTPSLPNPLLQSYFDVDPLISIGSWLASHSLPKVFLFSLVTIAATIVFGRVFCGWLCPLGTVHHLATWLGAKVRRSRRRRRISSRDNARSITCWRRC